MLENFIRFIDLTACVYVSCVCLCCYREESGVHGERHSAELSEIGETVAR